MSDINFLESETRKPKKSNLGKLLALVFILLVGAVLVFLTLLKTAELAGVTILKGEKIAFIESPDTAENLRRYNDLKAAIDTATNENLPISMAYRDYQVLNTVTSSLLYDHVWAPIRGNEDTLEFRSLHAEGNRLTITVGIENVGEMRNYQEALVGQTVTTSDQLTDDTLNPLETEIAKFSDRFTTQIADRANMSFDQPFEGEIILYFNNQITVDMLELLGRAR